MIVLFTDFGPAGPYTGQVKTVLARQAPGVPVIDLFTDAPAFDPQSSAYLLEPYTRDLPAGTVVLAVVDPGVGTARRPLIVDADGRVFIGPDNGLFEMLRRRTRSFEASVIDWRPAKELSATFHGRDLFAPVAAKVVRGERPASIPVASGLLGRPDWPDDLPRIVYIDAYGNAMTGMRAETLGKGVRVVVGETSVPYADTFEEVPPGTPLWYGNSNGLVEIAVNCGRADRSLGLCVGTPLALV